MLHPFEKDLKELLKKYTATLELWEIDDKSIMIASIPIKKDKYGLTTKILVINLGDYYDYEYNYDDLLSWD